MTPLPSFEDFFKAAHDFEPFPWQRRLAREVLAEGWPDLLDLPTGAGKTSALDVALYCLAVAPDRLPRRTVLVIDRRIVVDQGADHARELLRRMRRAAAGPLKAIADALRALVWRSDPIDDPFAVAVMRGGMPRDEDWAKRPDQPVIGISTVDQLGSRLLFRGYGVSSRSAPIHAGLIGNDTLILLDEVHLAVPFEQTLSAICKRHRTVNRALPNRFGVVRMSATAGSRDPAWRVFTLQDEDRKHPVLSDRLTASKLARLLPVKVRGDDGERRSLLAKAAVEHALELQKRGRVVAIVVNRVDTARLAHRLLNEKHADVTDAALVTGRMRPIDRDRFVRDVLLKRVGPRKARMQSDKPLILVATQCIEAGADLDFDALVTECASLDALKQRFGRLDRQGLLRQSEAIILGRSDAVAPDADADPVYGLAMSACWQWLEKVARDAVVDFGISALPPCVTEAGKPRQDVLARTANAPVLLPAHLDAWAQTSPLPARDPDVDLWLHGPGRAGPDAQVVWRSELQLPGNDATESDIASLQEAMVQALSGRRPSSLEAIPVPLAAARRWLAGEAASLIADVTATMQEENESRRRRNRDSEGRDFVALRWMGEESQFVKAEEIRPGDTLIVPATRGGIAAGTFDPASTEPVIDVADLAQLRARHIASLLLQRDALRVWDLPADLNDAPQPDDEEAAAETRTRFAEWIAMWPGERPPSCRATDAEWRALKGTFARVRRLRVRAHGQWLLANAPVPRKELGSPETTESVSEDDDSSFRQKEVTLARHSHDVRDFCEGYARALGLDADLVKDLRIAAWLHDVGKVDPRFQMWLVGGSEVRATLLKEPLAKSALPAGNRRERQLARTRAGYPSKYRHELLSLSMIEQNVAVTAQVVDRELVLHLVASHHGWCRPLAPAVDHPEDFAVQLDHDGMDLKGQTRHLKSRLDSGIGDRFWLLVEKYGWWGLAWLEAIMRLADHRASEMEAEDQHERASNALTRT